MAARSTMAARKSSSSPGPTPSARFIAPIWPPGADVLETDTFTGTRLKLDDYELGDRTYEINLAAARLAREAADEFSTAERPRFVAGSMGPTGMLPSSDDPSLSNITYQQLAELYREQAVALIEGGVDLLLIETSQDILEVRAAITGIRRACAEAGRMVPIQAQVTLDTQRTHAARHRYRRRRDHPLQPARGRHRPELLDRPGAHARAGALAHREHPAADLDHPQRRAAAQRRRPGRLSDGAGADGRGARRVRRRVRRQHRRRLLWHDAGAHQPHRRAPGRRSTPPRSAARRSASPNSTTRRASARTARRLRRSARRRCTQDPAPLLVGERVNSQGSRKVKQALLADDYDTLLQVAREQVEGGAHVLDVLVALTERGDEAEQMRLAVKKLEMGIEAPLVIDSTEANVMQAALETYPGRAIINSINLENRARNASTRCCRWRASTARRWSR